MLADPLRNFIPKRYPQGDVIQFFNESPQLYSTAVCSPNGCLKAHNGWDCVRPYGTPIYAVEAGTVVEVFDKGTGYGRNIRILTDEGVEWVYAHLSAFSCALNDRLVAGQEVGKLGNSGFVVSGSTPYWSTNPYAGAHVHIGRRRFQPYSGTGGWNITYANGTKGTILNHDNGYFGSYDISPTEFAGFVPPTKPMHKFLRNLEYGMMADPDVKKLQEILVYEGLLKVAPTGNYLDMTADAMKRYQLAHGLITQWHAFRYGGKYCYEITRANLNQRYG